MIDPHASKISPEDPRLRFVRPWPRTLRKGPVIAVVAGILITLGLAVAVALRPAGRAPPTYGSGDPSTPPPAPSIPETIRSAPTARGAAKHPPIRGGLASVGDAGWLAMRSSRRLGSERDPRADIVADQDRRALEASILFDVHSPPDVRDDLVPQGAEPATAVGLSTAPRARTEPATSNEDAERQTEKNTFLQAEGAASTNDALETTVTHPRSSCELQAGTIVPAVLVTAITSDLPGPVIAQVRENVYDTVTGNTLLVPQGARLIAQYDSMVTWGQGRLLVCWKRLLFPNGDSIDLHCMPGADLQGNAGLADQVDEHWARLVAGAAVSSLLAATAQGAAGNTSGFSPSVPQLWANGGAQAVNQSGQQVVRRDLIVPPTITVRAGFSVNVIINEDIALPPYRDDAEL